VTAPGSLYVCRASATWPNRAIELGLSQSDALDYVLGWLRAGALRLADRLDPSPLAPCYPPGALVSVDAAPDAATALRSWAADPDEQAHTRRVLSGSGRFELTVRDGETRFTFTAGRAPRGAARAVPAARLCTPPQAGAGASANAALIVPSVRTAPESPR
jgi:hypothetical protein